LVKWIDVENVMRLIQSTEAMNKDEDNYIDFSFYGSGMFYICWNKIVKFYWKLEVKMLK